MCKKTQKRNCKMDIPKVRLYKMKSLYLSDLLTTDVVGL